MREYYLHTKHTFAKVVLQWSRYLNKRDALILVNPDNHWEVIMKASVNIPNALLDPDEIIIKDSDENEGVLEFLQSNGIVSEVIGYVPSGYVHFPYVKILKRE